MTSLSGIDADQGYGKVKVLGLAIAIAVFIGGSVSLLNQKAAAAQPSTSVAPLPVETLRVDRSESYEFDDLFAGAVEPRQTTNLAFERGGKIAALFVDEGDVVAAGAVIAKLDTALLDAIAARQAADVARFEADLKLAELTAERQKQLYTDGHVSAQRYDDARLRAVSVAAQLQAAEAALASTRIDLEKSALRAPFAGRVGSRRVDEGAVVNVGTAIITLLEADRYRARIGLSVDAARALQEEAAFKLFVGGDPVEAKLVTVRPDVDPLTRTRDALFDVIADFPIAYGEIARLEVTRFVQARGFWLPVTAVREGQKGMWVVYMLDDNTRDAEGAPRIISQNVEILYSNEREIYVTGPLGESAEIVTRGVSRVVTGQRVKPVNTAKRYTALSSDQSGR